MTTAQRASRAHDPRESSSWKTSRTLGAGGYTVLSAEDGHEALDRVARTRPDLILLDIVMPGMNGITVLEHLRTNPTGRAVPVIIISAYAAQMAEKLRGREETLGLVGILGKPLDPSELLFRVQHALVLSPRPVVLVVEDDAGLRRLERRLLEDEGCEVHLAADGREALTRLAQRVYDAIILDLHVPYVDGHQIAQAIRQSETNRRTPIVMVTGLGDARARRKGFENQILFFLHKPFTAEAFRAAIRGMLD